MVRVKNFWSSKLACSTSLLSSFRLFGEVDSLRGFHFKI
jgi:hypothetical protein